MTAAGIYIHIPFCRVKCVYCDFYSAADQNQDLPRFIHALIEEIKRFDFAPYTKTFDTLFIGGGTPSLIKPAHLEKILKTLSKKIDLSKLTEITLEANPGEAPAKKLADFHSLGVNRLSLGVQTLEPTLLKFLTRIHTVEDVFSTFNFARKAGFENINCDLIFSIPGQTKTIWKRDLKTIINLGPEHISAYSLTLEPETKLNKLVKQGKVVMPSSDTDAKMYQITRDILTSNGYEQYEISNFAQQGKECRHNLHYWQIDPYVGLGPSAHGFDGKNRYNNVCDLDRYLRIVESGQSPVENSYIVSEKEMTHDLIGFGLRTVNGLQLNRIAKNHSVQIEKELGRLEKWKPFILHQNGSLKLTGDGFAFADAIASDLMVIGQ
ncbi:MAG TPA: radical SAM family heme chaperone HemW [Candidatus Marinimicrobia bacterium]|nr:radical SAM family heme chaperone HemW [Candidatus Neomarinimicrobiota bacterium]MDP6261656.1 radical SAM family heme chaperone HemW [Candidatus Neomarinimicrobiota bacterium]MDP7126776.1 radical SAM family heme chaperone HemW [Candidatus Neomarinimicrobiota bacterium]MDP7475719.1 radical SAM family heme chaperone HemW [Candidatus Neomarinimicrobiota bacterium]MDP7526546.1 radical SAM family heme chaperone HemW [Candidatus Neomarinimicrobiota bacterium]